MTPPAPHKGAILSLALMLAIVVANAWLQIALGDHIQSWDGLGYDGYLYGELARDLPGRLQQPISEDRLQRILPSVIIWNAFQVAGVTEATNEQIINAFS